MTYLSTLSADDAKLLALSDVQLRQKTRFKHVGAGLVTLVLLPWFFEPGFWGTVLAAAGVGYGTRQMAVQSDLDRRRALLSNRYPYLAGRKDLLLLDRVGWFEKMAECARVGNCDAWARTLAAAQSTVSETIGDAVHVLNHEWDRLGSLKESIQKGVFQRYLAWAGGMRLPDATVGAEGALHVTVEEAVAGASQLMLPIHATLARSGQAAMQQYQGGHPAVALALMVAGLIGAAIQRERLITALTEAQGKLEQLFVVGQAQLDFIGDTRNKLAGAHRQLETLEALLQSQLTVQPPASPQNVIATGETLRRLLAVSRA